MGIKPWLIVEKAKTDSPIELEENLGLTPLLELSKNDVTSFLIDKSIYYPSMRHSYGRRTKVNSQRTYSFPSVWLNGTGKRRE